MEASLLGGCAYDGLWAKGGQGESGRDSSVTVGSLSKSRLTTYMEKKTHSDFLM